MRHFLRFGWAAAVGLAVGSGALGQTNGTGTGTGTGTGQSSGGSSGTAQTVEAPPTISGTSLSGATSGRSGATVNSSNFLGPFYGNPYYQGRAGATNAEAPGGFGAALYGTSGGGGTGTGGFGTTSTGRTGTTGGRTGTTGFGGTGTGGTGGFGGTGTGGTGGFGGTGGGFGGTQTGFGATGGRGGQGMTGLGGQGFGGQGAASSAQVIALPRPISYTASLRFSVPPMTAPRMHAEARAVLDRSVSLSNPRGIEVVADGTMVFLRGTVRDEDEARLAENMIRLTPGVRDVKNELKFPNP